MCCFGPIADSRRPTAEQHVGRLQVAVDDVVLVGVLDGAGQGVHQLGGRGRGPGGAVEPQGEAAPLDILQDQIRMPVALTDFVDLDDVRVLQPGDGLRLGAEAGTLLGAAWRRAGSSSGRPGGSARVCRAL